MLEDAVNDTANTEGRLDDVRDKLLFLSRVRLLLKANHLASELELFTLSRDLDSLRLSDLGGKALSDVFISVLEEIDNKLLLFLELLA